MARLGTLLVVLGLGAMGFGVLWQLGVVPGSRVTLPPPVALGRGAAGTREVSTAGTPAAAREVVPTSPPGAPTEVPTVVPAPTAAAAAPTPVPARLPLMGAADVADRVADARTSGAGYAVHLTIPAIKVDAVVEQGGIVEDANGDPIWETRPFVAVQYGDLTSRIGVPGNAVIVGHVVTLSEGNVFRFLYQLDLGDQINVWDGLAREHDFQVVDVKLVPPTDTSVMDPTPDETLTLITCGGTFDPVKREFSDRLIVTAKPL
jgi:LPXTG-site transpeptidase (sortase) family protein